MCSHPDSPTQRRTCRNLADRHKQAQTLTDISRQTPRAPHTGTPAHKRGLHMCKHLQAPRRPHITRCSLLRPGRTCVRSLSCLSALPPRGSRPWNDAQGSPALYMGATLEAGPAVGPGMGAAVEKALLSPESRLRAPHTE